MPAAPIVPPLSPHEARVLGALIEKEFATPEYYPLTLNSLVLACNQKSNRDPLLNLGTPEVESALASLRSRRLVSVFAGADARVPKHKQTLDNVFPLEPAARALIAELLLRGPQTAAGLRGNAERLCALPDLSEVEGMLSDLAAQPSGGLVKKLARQPGQKEARWTQCLADEAAVIAPPELPLPPSDTDRRIAALEIEVGRLRAELAELRRALGDDGDMREKNS